MKINNFKLLASTAFTFSIIIAIALLSSCNKKKETEKMEVLHWSLLFHFVDSSGNLLFARQNDLPFDPDEAYYINGLGEKKSIRNHMGIKSRGSHDSTVTFQLITTIDVLRIEKDKSAKDEFLWLLYIDVNRSPDTIKFSNPYYSGVDYLMINSDTVYNRSKPSDEFLRAFYLVY